MGSGLTMARDLFEVIEDVARLVVAEKSRLADVDASNLVPKGMC